MECNRDEANRAKEIAEKKFTEKDIRGAKKFAIKAKSLYPGLDGIHHMLATLDVYISADNQISREVDLYGILGVNPKANDETVRKHYRKLALMLHPDKNKSIGAEGAFKIISEAWSVLSDKSRRLAYDQKRNTKVSQKNFPHANAGPAAPSCSNGFSNFRAQKGNAAKAGTSSAPPCHKKKLPTFWTVCHRCNMQYEYLRMYLNLNLLCPNCQDPFFAIEISPPMSNGSKASIRRNNSQQQQKNHESESKNASTVERNNSSTANVGSGRFNSIDSANHSTFQWGPFSKTAGAASAAQAATVVKQAYERAKRECEKVQAETKRVEGFQRKNRTNRKTGGFSSSGHSDGVKRRKGTEDAGPVKFGKDDVSQMGRWTGGTGITGLSGLKQCLYEPSGADKPKSSWVSSYVGIQHLLMEKVRTNIDNKVKEWNEFEVKGKENGIEKQNEGGRVKDNDMIKGARQDQWKNSDPVDGVNESDANKFIPGISGGEVDNEPLGPMSMDVPDPDFHDFDKERTERRFGENQVWAAYDDDDGMPRYYAMIHNVISLRPLKMRISWLNPRPNSELCPLNLVGSVFSKTCGDFRIGKHVLINSLNLFSHNVTWKRGARGVRIFPRKGDVWALYRNWSPEWNELTADDLIHKYDMMEVLEDYDLELGATVTPLVKVAGFKTVFHRHLDHREMRRIPREEIFRFSHQVPSYMLTGQEAPNAPKGCHELDPAALPLELLQVITYVKEEDIVDNEEVKVEKVVNDDGKPDNKEMKTSCCSSNEEILGIAKERK